MALDVVRRLGCISVGTVLSGYVAVVVGAVDPPKCRMDGWTIGMGQHQARTPTIHLTEWISRNHGVVEMHEKSIDPFTLLSHPVSVARQVGAIGLS